MDIGPDAAPVRRDPGECLFSQGFCKGATKKPGISVGWLPRPAADEFIAEAESVDFTNDF